MKKVSIGQMANSGSFTKGPPALSLRKNPTGRLWRIFFPELDPKSLEERFLLRISKRKNPNLVLVGRFDCRKGDQLSCRNRQAIAHIDMGGRGGRLRAHHDKRTVFPKGLDHSVFENPDEMSGWLPAKRSSLFGDGDKIHQKWCMIR